MSILPLCMLLVWTGVSLPSASRLNSHPRSQASSNYKVNIQVTPPPTLFPEEFLKPPLSARATFFDPVCDNSAIERIKCLLHEELSRYPNALLKQNLTEILLVKSLSLENVAIGGLNWPTGKRIYIQDSGIQDDLTDEYIRSSVHHELAHILLFLHASRFSRNRWEHLNHPGFHYGGGGLESIRTGQLGTHRLDPASWEQGFASPYGTSEIDEDFASLCEAIFSGDPRFWEAVDRVEILKKKVKTIIAFYHALDKTMDETYFRQMVRLSGSAPSLVHGNAPKNSHGGFRCLYRQSATYRSRRVGRTRSGLSARQPAILLYRADGI